MAELVNLDVGLHRQFVNIKKANGIVYTGQVVGVYNEDKFMWNPSIHSTLAVFTCTDVDAALDSFR